MNVSFSALIVFACLFGLLAGACAFLITFDEYSRHFPVKKKAFRAAFPAGLFAFLFFGGATIFFVPLLFKIVTTIIAH